MLESERLWWSCNLQLAVVDDIRRLESALRVMTACALFGDGAVQNGLICLIDLNALGSKNLEKELHPKLFSQ